MRITHAHYLIIDVEATCCDQGSVQRCEMEIIEIGAVLMSSRSFEIDSEFQSFVHPVRHPLLMKFCTQLTGIKQSDVSDAPGFPQAIQALKDWMAPFEDALFCSWGAYDRKQFIQDCQFHGIEYPFRSGHLNLKEEFSRSLGLPKKLGIFGAVRKLNLEFLGTHHRGLDDARNMAQVVRAVCAGP